MHRSLALALLVLAGCGASPLATHLRQDRPHLLMEDHYYTSHPRDAAPQTRSYDAARCGTDPEHLLSLFRMAGVTSSDPVTIRGDSLSVETLPWTHELLAELSAALAGTRVRRPLELTVYELGFELASSLASFEVSGRAATEAAYREGLLSAAAVDFVEDLAERQLAVVRQSLLVVCDPFHWAGVEDQARHAYLSGGAGARQVYGEAQGIWIDDPILRSVEEALQLELCSVDLGDRGCLVFFRVDDTVLLELRTVQTRPVLSQFPVLTRQGCQGRLLIQPGEALGLLGLGRDGAARVIVVRPRT